MNGILHRSRSAQRALRPQRRVGTWGPAFRLRSLVNLKRASARLAEALLIVVFVLSAALAGLTTLAAQDSRFTQLAVLPVAAELVEASGGRAYTVLGRTVTAFDISNPDA